MKNLLVTSSKWPGASGKMKGSHAEARTFNSFLEKKWLKSFEVRKLLKISPIFVKGIIPEDFKVCNVPGTI